jgi:hypothetical protein
MSNGPTKTQAAMQKKRSKQMVIQQTARIKASEKKTNKPRLSVELHQTRRSVEHKMFALT